jgi:hypothetical protein
MELLLTDFRVFEAEELIAVVAENFLDLTKVEHAHFSLPLAYHGLTAFSPSFSRMTQLVSAQTPWQLSPLGDRRKIIP